MTHRCLICRLLSFAIAFAVLGVLTPATQSYAQTSKASPDRSRSGPVVRPQGTNGQQVQVSYPTTISTSCGTYYVTGVRVEGSNQNGQYANWYQSVSKPYCGWASSTTSGWWWKGTIQVTVYYNWGAAYRRCSFNVPTFAWGDIYAVSC